MSLEYQKPDYRRLDIANTIESVSAHIAEDPDSQAKIKNAYRASPEELVSEEVARDLAVLGMQLAIRDAIASTSTVEGEKIIPNKDQIVESVKKLMEIRSDLTLAELNKLVNEYGSASNLTRGNQIIESLFLNAGFTVLGGIVAGTLNNVAGFMVLHQSPTHPGYNVAPQIYDFTDLLADKLRQVSGVEISADMLFWLLVVIAVHTIFPRAIALIKSGGSFDDEYKAESQEVKKNLRFKKLTTKADLVREYMEKEIDVVTQNFYQLLHEITSTEAEITTLEEKNPADPRIPSLKARVYIRMEMLKKLSQGEDPTFEYEIGGRKQRIDDLPKSYKTPVVIDAEFEGTEPPKDQKSEPKPDLKGNPKNQRIKKGDSPQGLRVPDGTLPNGNSNGDDDAILLAEAEAEEAEKKGRRRKTK